MVPTICILSKYNLYQPMHRCFGNILISRLKLMARKRLMKGLQKNLPDLEDPCPIFILTMVTKIPRGPTTYVSTPPPRVNASNGFCVFQC